MDPKDSNNKTTGGTSAMGGDVPKVSPVSGMVQDEDASSVGAQSDANLGVSKPPSSPTGSTATGSVPAAPSLGDMSNKPDPSTSLDETPDTLATTKVSSEPAMSGMGSKAKDLSSADVSGVEPLASSQKTSTESSTDQKPAGMSGAVNEPGTADELSTSEEKDDEGSSGGMSGTV